MKKGWIFLLIGLLVGSGAAVFAADDKDETREAVVHAEQLSESGYHLDAIVAYEKLLEENPGDKELKEKIAREYLLAGDGRTASDLLEEMSGGGNGREVSADIYCDLVCSYLENEDMESAIRILRQAKELYPENGKIDHLHRELRGMYESSALDYTPVRELDNGYMLAYNAEDQLRLMDPEGHEYPKQTVFDGMDDMITVEEGGKKTVLMSVYDLSSDKTERCNYRYVDKDGNMRVTPEGEYSYLGCPRDGKILFRDKEGWGYLDESMKDVGVRYEDATAFCENTAAVKENGRWRIISTEDLGAKDESNTVWYEDVVTDERKICSASGNVFVKTETGYRLVSPSGKALSEVYAEVRAFFGKDGVAAVRKDEKWGLIDAKGQETCPLRFEETASGDASMAAFRKGDRWGYIHKSGEIYVEPEFASAGRMSKDGKAYVTLGSAWQIRLLIAGEESITDE